MVKVQNPDTGRFYNKRDNDGNIIKGTGPKHIIKQIVRVRRKDGSEFLTLTACTWEDNAFDETVKSVFKSRSMDANRICIQTRNE